MITCFDPDHDSLFNLKNVLSTRPLKGDFNPMHVMRLQITHNPLLASDLNQSTLVLDDGLRVSQK